jgi:integrase
MPKTPAYRLRKGYTQAIVTLTDAVTKRRRDYWLGEHGYAESRNQYHCLIADWEANGRRLPAETVYPSLVGPPASITVVEVSRQYWRWAEGYYDRRRAGAIKTALRILTKYHGGMPAGSFGPQKLRMLREEMIRGDQATDPPRPPWSRKYINSQVQCIRHVFKWAAARELVPVTVHQSLCTLEPLKRGRSAAYENEKVGPAPQHLIKATKPFMSGPVRALVELQLLTGTRPGELLGLRLCDLKTNEKTGIWQYRPREHKNQFREHERVIYFGPQAQAILEPFMRDRPTNAYLFSPAEAEQERRAAMHAARKTPLSCGNRPGTNCREAPAHKPGDRYTTDSYRRAITYASDKAFPPPEPLRRRDDETAAEWRARLTGKQRQKLNAWRKEHRWHPHQLRHNAATAIRSSFGLEAAQLALGHASAQITDAVYAERDHSKVVEIMSKIG